MSTVATGDLARANALRTSIYELSLADRSILQPELYPQILFGGSVTRAGVNVLTVPRLNLGNYAFAAPTPDEDSAVATTAYTEVSIPITVGRRSLGHAFTSLALDTDNILTDPMLLQSLLVDAGRSLTGAIAALAAGFSTVVGSTGVENGLVNHLTAQSVLEGKDVPGPFLAVYHAHQWRGLRAEHALAVGGAAQNVPASGSADGSTGYKGLFFGAEVFISNRIPLSGSDRQGMMIGQSAILMADMQPTVRDASRQAAIGRVKVEYSRTSPTDVDTWYAHTYFGVTEYEDARGVQILSRN